MSDPNHFTPPRTSGKAMHARIRFLLLIMALLAFAWIVRTPAARAQQSASLSDDKETLKIVDAIDDIDRLRSLNPLKLTTDELGRIIALISASQETYKKKLNTLAAERVAKMSDEVLEAKKQMLVGGDLPADLDKRLQKASTDFITKRDQLDLENIATIDSALKEILSPEQVKAAVAMSRDSPLNANKSAKATDAQWFNLFTANVMLTYPRILPLLKEMRAAR